MIEVNVLTGTILETNNYVLVSKENAVMIEASCSVESIKNVLQGRKLTAILLTHGHWDHYWELENLSKEFNCPIYITRQAKEKIEKKEKTFTGDRNPKIDLTNVEIKYVSNGDEIKFDNDLCFKVVSTPGHTNCSVSYLLNSNDEIVVFVGDLIFRDGVGRTDLPTGNFEDLKSSIKKILGLNDETLVFSGHGRPTTIGEEREKLLHLF